MTQETKPSLSLETSTLFDKALKLLFLLHQEFGAAFKEVTNEVLRTNIKQ